MVTASPMATTTYDILGANAGGACESNTSITVFVEGQLWFTDTTIVICEGDSVEIEGIFYTQNAEIPIINPSIQDGCDSTHTFNVVVTPLQTLEEITLCEGDTITLFGREIFGATTLDSTFVTPEGCSTTLTFNVSVTQPPNISVQEITSDPIVIGDSTLLNLPLSLIHI